MNRKISLLALVVVLLTGCIVGIPDTAAKPAVSVELLPSSPGKVSSYSLRQEDGKFVVAGRVTSLNPIRSPGHVDLVVCAPDGQATGHYQAPIHDYASKRGGLKEARFSMSLEPGPAEGSVIRLKYDAPPSEEGHQLNCKMESVASR